MDLLRETASGELFRILRDAILAGTYAPGEKLPPQRALALEYGVNATTVREAIKRLEQLRLVVVRHGDAMRVSDWRTQTGLDVIAHVLVDADGPRRDAVAALMEARRLLLAGAARMAAERRTPAQGAELAELAQAAAAARDVGPAQLADFAFFAALVEAAGNLVLSLILNSVRPVYLEHAALFAAIVGPQAAVSELYPRAAAAVVEGNAEAAEALVAELAERQERALLAGIR